MMGRIPTTNNVTKSVSKSNNAQLSMLVKGNITSNKKDNMVWKNSDSPQQKSLRIFKYFIFSTSIVFGFGCFGFGLVLRFNQVANLSEFNPPNNNSSLVRSHHKLNSLQP